MCILDRYSPPDLNNIRERLNKAFDEGKQILLLVTDTGIGSMTGPAERVYRADNGTIAIQQLVILGQALHAITYYLYPDGGYQRTDQTI